jgi:polysaccharide pyruvyl transferase CsaB
MRKVLICGYYGASNRGDELILKVLTDFLKKRDVNVTVLSLDPASTAREYGVRAVKSSSSLKKGIGRFFYELLLADTFVLGGGGLFQDYGKHFRVVLYYGMRVLLAGLLRKKIAYFALGVGNIELESSKRFINRVTKNVDVISVRDEGSKTALIDLGVRSPITVCADPVFALIPDVPAVARPANGRMRVGISVLAYDRQLKFSSGADEKVAESIARFCTYLLGNNYDVTFVPMERGTDDRFIDNILKRGGLGGRVSVIDSSLGHDEFMAEYAQCDVVVGMRLHSIILASIIGIPFLPISYHSKVANVARSLGQEDLSIPLEEIDGDTLIRNFELLQEGYDGRRAEVEARVVGLRDGALSALRLLDKLLNDKNGTGAC